MIRRGDIWWVAPPEPAGSEPGYRRPMVIVQADSFNQSLIRTVIGVILTTNVRGSAPYPAESSSGSRRASGWFWACRALEGPPTNHASGPRLT